ncbi:MAG: hypothetical protein SFX18_08800 [Pirellulales bacterium]|nr:hypothetical protein [Pirellulales bacterium]
MSPATATTALPTLAPRILRAGPLVLRYEPENGFIREIYFGQHEVLRGIFPAVRDRHWNTIPPALTWQDIRAGERDFTIKFIHVVHRPAGPTGEEIGWEWRGVIRGTELGQVRYEVSGTAQIDFYKNRVGLCVLHPLTECAGKPCEVWHGDGTHETGTFPLWIAPHQPFLDIRQISHTVALATPEQPEIQARVSFWGDTFEMEDQRNWSDASYKTYSTPLALPFPVRVAAGTRVQQSVALELFPEISSSPVVSSDPQTTSTAITVEVDWRMARRLPRIGLALPANSLDMVDESRAEVLASALDKYKSDHLRCELNLANPHWPEHLQAALRLTQRSATQLEVALVAAQGAEAAWGAVCHELSGHQQWIARILLYSANEVCTPEWLVQTAERDLAGEFAARLVVGTNAYFAEFNRQRPLVPYGGMVCFSLHPQVHATDRRSICESVQSYRWLIESARMAGDCPVVISPLTLCPRFFPPREAQAAITPITRPDPRQQTDFAAAWTVAALGELTAQPALHSVTMYETHGLGGIMDAMGREYPVARVFAALRDCYASCPASSSQPLAITPLALQTNNDQRRLLLANLTDEVQIVRLRQESWPSPHAPARTREWRLPPDSVQILQQEDLA